MPHASVTPDSAVSFSTRTALSGGGSVQRASRVCEGAATQYSVPAATCESAFSNLGDETTRSYRQLGRSGYQRRSKTRRHALSSNSSSYRQEVRPFTDKQVALLANFHDGRQREAQDLGDISYTRIAVKFAFSAEKSTRNSPVPSVSFMQLV
jgi:hypothetical protein